MDEGCGDFIFRIYFYDVKFFLKEMVNLYRSRGELGVIGIDRFLCFRRCFFILLGENYCVCDFFCLRRF